MAKVQHSPVVAPVVVIVVVMSVSMVVVGVNFHSFVAIASVMVVMTVAPMVVIVTVASVVVVMVPMRFVANLLRHFFGNLEIKREKERDREYAENPLFFLRSFQLRFMFGG